MIHYRYWLSQYLPQTHQPTANDQVLQFRQKTEEQHAKFLRESFAFTLPPSLSQYAAIRPNLSNPAPAFHPHMPPPFGLGIRPAQNFPYPMPLSSASVDSVQSLFNSNSKIMANSARLLPKFTDSGADPLRFSSPSSSFMTNSKFPSSVLSVASMVKRSAKPSSSPDISKHELQETLATPGKCENNVNSASNHKDLGNIDDYNEVNVDKNLFLTTLKSEEPVGTAITSSPPQSMSIF